MEPYWVLFALIFTRRIRGGWLSLPSGRDDSILFDWARFLVMSAGTGGIVTLAICLKRRMWPRCLLYPMVTLVVFTAVAFCTFLANAEMYTAMGHIDQCHASVGVFDWLVGNSGCDWSFARLLRRDLAALSLRACPFSLPVRSALPTNSASTYFICCVSMCG